MIQLKENDDELFRMMVSWLEENVPSAAVSRPRLQRSFKPPSGEVVDFAKYRKRK